MSYTELQDSQAPAILLLQKMGWKYLSTERMEQERNVTDWKDFLDRFLSQQVMQKLLTGEVR